MDPAVRLASTVADPLVSQLLLPVEATPDNAQTEDELLARLVSFRGESPPMSYESLLSLVGELVALTASGYRLLPQDEAPVAGVLSRTLWIAGELDTTDVQAVRLGPQDFARKLRSAVPGADRELSPDAAWFHDRLLVTVCLHLLHHLIRRSPRLAERMPERAHRIRQLIDLNDVEAVRGRPEPSAIDAEFEVRYARSVVEQYNRVTIYGIDLPNPNTPDSWSLDATYLSLSAEFDNPEDRTETAPPRADGDSGEPVLPADRALGGHERVLLRGVAGSGKTTLVQWLAVSTARDALPPELASLRGRIPLVLPVRRFAREGFPPPDDFLRAIRHPLADEAPDGWVARVLTEERGLLLVDGIDEAPESERTALRGQLRRLMRIYSGNFCLVTARPSAVEPNWLADEGFDELALAPMNRDQVAAFITAWHAAAGDDEGKDHRRLEEYRDRLLASIPLYRELRGLATNPLMCGLICALNRDRSGSLPQGRKELYEAAMEMLLQRRDPERRVLYADAVKLQRGARERLLRKLAYRMLVDRRVELTMDEALEEIARQLPAIPSTSGQGAPEDIFNHLLLRTGLLREQSDRAVEFVHRTVQDYLAAKEAVDQGAFDLLLAHAHEAEWEEVMRMAVAHARPGECAKLLGGLLAPGRTGMQRNRRRLLAAACLEHVTELDPDTHARIRRETRHMVRPTTVEAARSLGWVGPIVLEMLPDPSRVTDREAHRLAVTVTRINDDAAIHYLAQLRNRASLELRAELARGWHNFDTDRYAEEIIGHLDPEGLYFPVSDRFELAALRKLGGRSRVQIVGQFTPDELLGGLSHDQLTHLWLAYDLRVPMGWLAAFPHLTTLRVNPRLPRVNGVPDGIRILS
ncbi:MULTISPECIES: NACHT domain-containing protein [unclassified Streptomyces]|uniref:NACHT domain-containing protein n=1 Tax=unclassified Streptomyces TaxID=2593676 RepID=UPI002DD86699|nr:MULTISPECIES: NACHT domain-containing protein [unclassified Streptomyces]WSA93180.1 NACHT domain-containing protein [Streptomyces sp. NBC_01795]WSB77551.1 NACHT domain-containing protein [Streptomyces sp. NBC_01775]WSS14183.1 NACHT domain-containing protein [Streptomyces sp. NBC_01186]WSS43004.1 NACHT domain-containing protein [Streptomyces sp. NBC_01187]